MSINLGRGFDGHTIRPVSQGGYERRCPSAAIAASVENGAHHCQSMDLVLCNYERWKLEIFDGTKRFWC